MYCQSCGHENGNGQKFCSECGAKIESIGKQQNKTTLSLNTNVVWRRILALVIDMLIVCACVFVYSFLDSGIVHALEFANANDSVIILVADILEIGSYAIMIFGVWLYFSLMESSRKQATIGKSVMGIKVTDLNGDRISFGPATGRYWGHLLSQIILYIGFIMAIFNTQRQCLHDMMTGTLVIRNNQMTNSNQSVKSSI